MPHGLGHGVGLDIHEYPRVNVNAAEDTRFLAGMVVTLEPGLYDTELGGCRWENDILVTDGEPEVLTRSRIVRL
jgi:Xaa-Pro aminopeptidase